MFSTREFLIQKTGKDGIGRLCYLQSLVTEFQDSSDEGKIIHAKLETGQSKILCIGVVM